MTKKYWYVQELLVFSIALIVTLTATEDCLADTQVARNPPISRSRMQLFKSNPSSWNQFISQIPLHPTATTLPSSSQPLLPQPSLPASFGGTWQTVALAPVTGLCNPHLLTDGTVVVHQCNTPNWYKLTPDILGSYVTGTWTQIASLPIINGTQYAPDYYASAVLPDGRLIIMGGEYNNGGTTPVESNLGAIYDPVANTWTAVSAPAGTAWTKIGDAPGVVLANGTFMLGGCCTASPTAEALFNATTLGWTTTSGPIYYQNEQGYNLLPNGNILTVDIWSGTTTAPTTAEQYVPASGTWASAGNTPVSLVDPYVCANYEIGPAVLRADGSVVAFGGNTGCAGASSPTDPTAIYNSVNGVWSAGPNLPAICGATGTTSCNLADAPAALLPNGNILLAANAGFGGVPTHFFEYTGTNVINQVADTLNFASSSSAFYYNFLLLPNGQVLSTDFSNVPEVYTPTGSPNSSWAPVISNAPSLVNPGQTYQISGLQFNGLSQGATYGDDTQTSTNYPIVRITNAATGHVFYARTFNHNSMSVSPNNASSTNFAVPKNVEFGQSSVVVIANGIASQPVNLVVIKTPLLTAGLNYACALTSTGAVQCWGDNSYGQLGNGTTTNSTTPVAVTGLSTGVVAIAAGDYHACALTSAGAVKCWGRNNSGQLGNTTTQSTVPVTVTGISSGVISIAAGTGHTCAMTSAGTMQCWGGNAFGQLGSGNTTNSTTPNAVKGLSGNVASIGAGGSQTCALTTAGAAQCWGYNVDGELGNSSTTNSPTPVTVTGLGSGVVSVAAGYSHSCALTNTNVVQCWGYNGSGELGPGTTASYSSTPITVTGLLSGIISMTAGGSHTCALNNTGAVQCWGYNAYGELGNGFTVSSSSPVAVTGLSSGVVSIAAGNSETCALSSTGTLQCWGLNTSGQLGDGGTTLSSLPVSVSGLNLVLTAQAQTISFGTLVNEAIINSPFTVSASATSGLPVSFSSTTTSICTVSGSTVTLVALGTCTIAANQAGNVTYVAAPQVLQSFTVSLVTQTITFGTAPSVSVGGKGVVTATGGASGNAVTFSAAPASVCTIAGSTVTGVAVGTCTITANQAGNTSYAAAPTVTQSFSVTAATTGSPTTGGDVPLPTWAYVLLATGLIGAMWRQQRVA
jgi:alpha-tubulin suppressor-like RCC1 family protein